MPTHLVLEPAERAPAEGVRALVRPGNDLLRVRGRRRGRGRWGHSRIHCNYDSGAQHDEQQGGCGEGTGDRAGIYPRQRKNGGEKDDPDSR